MLKNALVKNGVFFSLFGFGLIGLIVLSVFFNEGVDLVRSGAVEVDGCCLIGDRERDGSFAVSSSFSSNAVLQKSKLRTFARKCSSR